MKKLSANLKKMLVALSLGAIFLLSGIFFAACGESAASRISLSADKSSLTLYVGESDTVEFTIQNYEDSIDGSLSFSLVDSTVAGQTSEHVSLSVLSQNGATTVVQLTGQSGGKTTLVAMTNEGSKTCSVEIDVRQYSSSLTLKSDALLYVTDGTPFTPSADLFDFDDNATEVSLTFHRANIADDVGDNNVFASARLETDEQTGARTIRYYFENGQENSSIVEENVVDGREFVIFARYVSYTYVDGEREENVLVLPLSYYAIFGFEGEAISVLRNGEAVANGDTVSIVVNSKDEANFAANLQVTLPYSLIDRSQTGQELPVAENSFVKFSYSADTSLLAIERSEVVDNGNGTMSFSLNVTSSRPISQETQLVINAFYQIGDQSFASSEDASVSQTFVINLDMNIAPSNIIINNVSEDSKDNYFSLYNHYLTSSHGWQPLDVQVYEPNSDYTGVMVNFDESKVIVRQNGVNLASGDIILKENIDDLVYIRGAESLTQSETWEAIEFIVVSDYIDSDEQPPRYEVHYQILSGATALSFTNPLYNYQESNDDSGVFVSSSASAQIFDGIYADQSFAYATISFIEGDESAVGVSFDSTERRIESGAIRYYALLRVTPRSSGNATYLVTLDNGVSIQVTFRVINTFDDLSINLAGTGNDGVQSTSRLTDLGQDFEDGMQIVLQNISSADSITYNRQATVQLSSTSGIEMFDSVSFSSNYPNLARISDAGSARFTIVSSTYGEGEIEFTVSGDTVDEDFTRQTAQRKVKVVLVSVVPVNSFVMSNSQTGTATNVDLYIGSSVTNSQLQTVSFSESVSPSVAYGFYDPVASDGSESVYSNSIYSQRFLYWTVDGAEMYVQSTGGVWSRATRIVYGNIYRLGLSANNYFGTFDSTTMTFTVNRAYDNTFSFTMYASLRQYGTARYYPVTIQGLAYQNVQRIYSNTGSSLSFTALASGQSIDIGVFLSPSNITDTGITVPYRNQNTNPAMPVLIENSGITMSETAPGSGVWVVRLSLNSEVLSWTGEGTFGGRIEIVPNSWMNNGAVLSAYSGRILSFDVSYQDGSVGNPYLLEDPEDVLSISSALSAHYKISTTIDMTGYSSSLPLGNFAGSIVGETGSAKITGLNITNGSADSYGLFTSVSGSISNVAFEGSFNISSTSAITAGLIAATNSGTIEGVSVVINESQVSSAGGSIGGMFGENSGTISDMNVIFNEFLEISTSNSEGTYAAGIAAQNSGSITGGDTTGLYGYSAYSVYALIEVTQSSNQTAYSSTLAGSAAAVSAESESGNISQILAGGEIWARNAAGLVGNLTSGALYDSTTRVFVRGVTMGLIVYAYNNQVNGCYIGYAPNDSTSRPITVEATDDGNRLGQYAAMGIAYMSDDGNFDDGVGELTVSSDKIFIGQTGKALYMSTPTSYVLRELQGDFDEDEDGVNSPIYIMSFNDVTAYYGDFVVINEADNSITNRVEFTKQSTSFSVTPNTNSDFAQMHKDDCPAVSNEGACTCENNMIYAFYFEAAGYYAESGLTTSNLNQIQQELDVLNRLRPGDALYPIVVDGQSVQISSLSSNVEISTTGEMYIKGTGVAQIRISSLLNQNQTQIVYLNVINYFNYRSYLNSETGIFSIGNMILGNNPTFNVYSQSNVYVSLSPNYSLTEDEFGEGAQLSYGLESSNLDITSSGEVLLNNRLIQLANSSSFSVQVGGELTYGNYEASSNGVTFTKKPNVSVNPDSADKVSLTAYITGLAGDESYYLSVTHFDSVTINYYEGSKAIYSLQDTYPINSSNTIVDQVVIDSDDSTDELKVIIYDENWNIVDKYDGKQDKNVASHLFNIELNKKKGALNYNVRIGVDRGSETFLNRFNQNIYQTYHVVYYASSNGEDVNKTIDLTLRRESVDVIVATNYPQLSNVDQESDKIVPGQSGLLSISLSPVDADFDSILIRNNAMNYLDGAAAASFAVGTISFEEGRVVFNPISYEAAENGVRVTRSTLEAGSFSGQIYVRYIFSNYGVDDGTPVAIDVIAEQSPENYSVTFDYELLLEDSVSVQIEGYPTKSQVARGMEYKLDVRNDGYDDSTLQVISSNPQIGRIEQRDDGYYVVITNNEIDYSTGNGNFSITVSASRTDEFGMESTADDTLNLTVLEYVINYFPQEGESQDIISGMNNGVIRAPVGDRLALAVEFDGMIEYNPANQSVVNSINSFLTTLRNNGTWTFYSDLNINTSTGTPVKDIPLQKDNATSDRLGGGVSITTRYLSISDYSFVTYIAHDPEQRHYLFSYSGQYAIENGRYVWTDKVESGQTPVGYTVVETDINVDSFMRGSEESPNPITTYEEFLAMNAGGNYILLNDISVPAESFQPLNVSVASFDGNNHYFIFDSPLYDAGSASAVGLFGTINQDSYIRNVRIRIGSESVQGVTINSSSTTATSIGLVAGVNNGTLTNAQVEMADGAQLYVTFTNDPSSSGFYFGGIVGQNAGYLTNSRSMVNAQSVISMGGVAGQNSNIIASSAFKEGSLINRSQYATAFNVGGLVAENAENGEILTSYTSGFVTADKPYSDQTNSNGQSSWIDSRVSVGGFVNTNDGTITDCYANLPILSDASSAGFALYNTGTIRRSFSTSNILRGNSWTDYYFCSTAAGTFEDCFYITGDEINQSLFEGEIAGVTKLTYNDSVENQTNEFANLSEHFSSYSYSQTPSYNSVWFYSTGSVSSAFNGTQFAGGRLELVAPNIVATGQRVSAGTQTSAEGVITYLYETAPDSPANGSVNNPYMIHSAETMESYISASPSNIASGYYRIVCDISYSSQAADFFQTYNVDMQGVVEGNGMTISDVQITSNDTLSQAGLFASVSGTSTNRAAVVNLNVDPTLVSFPNVNVVGTLAGVVQNANIYNITVVGTTSAGTENERLLTVEGKNIVGGVIGLTQSAVSIKNVTSQISALASFVPASNNSNDITSSNYSENSFAGGVIGYVNGQTSLNIANINVGAVIVVADKAGLMFGGIGSQSTVDNVAITVNAEMEIRAHSYGGLIAGELRGTLSNAYVYSAAANSGIFSLQPYVATAVGGMVGVAKGNAIIDYAYMGHSFTIANQPIATVAVNTINYVGGLIGQVDGASSTVRISHAVVEADLNARNILGGVVGYVSANTSALLLSEVAVREGNLRIEGQNSSPVVGGMVGEVASTPVQGDTGTTFTGPRISIANSYVRADITLETYTYTSDINAYVSSTVANANGLSSISINTFYSTTAYNLVVEDKSSNEALGQVFRRRERSEETGDISLGTGFAIYYGRDFSTGDSAPEVGYINQAGSWSVTNTFNSSLWTAGGEAAFDFLDSNQVGSGFTTIQARKYANTNINIVQNEPGTDVYTANDNGLTEEGYSGRFDRTVYYNLFNEESIWETSLTDFSTLSFEAQLKI